MGSEKVKESRQRSRCAEIFQKMSTCFLCKEDVGIASHVFKSVTHILFNY